MNYLTTPTKSILCIFFLMTWGINAQGVNTFAKSYTNGGIGNISRETPDQGHIIVGGEDNYNFLGYDVFDPITGDWLRTGDIFLMKTDVDGNVMWQKSYGTDLSRETGKWIEITNDGGYIIVGSTTLEQNAGQGAPMQPGTDIIDSSDIVLIKTDADGNLQWSKIFDTGGDDVAWSVQQTSDDGYIIAAFCDTSPVTVFGAGPFAMLIKTDANGNLEWEKKYDFALRDAIKQIPFTYVAKQTNNGGYIIVGETIVEYICDLYVIRTKPNGDLEWANSYHAPPFFLNDHPGISGGVDVIEASDNSFIIAGFRDSIFMDLFEVNNPYVVKIDANGVFMNARLYDYPTWMARTGFSSVQETSDGNLIFAGNSGYDNAGFANAILKTDLNLNMIWSHYYDMGMVILGGARCIREISDGGYTMTGRYFMEDMSLIKMDSDGLIDCTPSVPMIEITPPVVTTNLIPGVYSGIGEAIWVITTDDLIEISTVNCAVNCLVMADATITSGVDYSLLDAPVDLTGIDAGGSWSGTGITDPIAGTFDPMIAGIGLHEVIYSFPGLCGDADTVMINVVAAPLPIELISFTAKPYRGSMVELNWQTASEVNNDYFIIECSKNGIDWHVVGNMDGAENSTTVINYQLIDANPYKGTSYYRLQQIDLNGDATYPQIVSVTLDEPSLQSVKIYPNPTSSYIIVEASASELSELHLYTPIGLDVSDNLLFIQLSDSSIKIDISSLPSGMYAVQTKSRVLKVIKK